MSEYCWTLAGIVKPFFCTEEGLMGIIKRGGGEPAKLTPIFMVEEKKSFLGQFQIARAKAFVGTPVAAVFDGDRCIATVKTDTIFVDREYWRRGIAGELIAEYWAVWPYHMIDRMANHERIRWRNESGEAAERKAFRLMLERGAVQTS